MVDDEGTRRDTACHKTMLDCSCDEANAYWSSHQTNLAIRSEIDF